jgi:hypothetical protein
MNVCIVCGWEITVDWMIARDPYHTLGDGPNFDGPRDAAIWTVYEWHRENEADWVEPMHPGGMTYAQAEEIARGMGYRGDPVGR